MGMTFIETVLLDSGLHVILLLLPLYYLLYKPLQVRTHVAETAQNELTTLSLNLEQIVNERSSDLIKEINLSHNHEQSLRERENELERSLLTQAIFNKLLFLSLENLPLNDSLERFLNLISSFPWFELQPKGAVFLKDPGSDHLLMICQRDLTTAPEFPMAPASAVWPLNQARSFMPKTLITGIISSMTACATMVITVCRSFRRTMRCSAYLPFISKRVRNESR